MHAFDFFAQIECIDASGAQVTPGMTVADYLKIDRTRIHALTGPIFIDGAEPGDVLQIDILATRHSGWGWTSVIEGLGFLKERFHEPYLFHWSLEGESSRSLAPAVVPVRPFLGVMGVARADDGSFRTRPPGPFGGNLDVRELCTGATLYLPVFNEGALFFAGDGHGVQGDGEVCITALETGVTGTFRLTVRKDMDLTWPFAESATHLMSIGLDEDLDDAAKQAVREMVKHICERTNLSRNQAYMLCSLAGNLRVTQLVDGNKGIHMLLPKSYL